MSGIRMAQPSTTSSAVKQSALTTSAAREWTGRAVDRLRRSVLPAHHEAVPALLPDTTARSIPHRLLLLIPRLVVVAAVVLLLAATGLFLFRQYYDNRIYPAVVVGDVNVGGLTASQAEIRLAERANALEQGTISFTYHGRTWTPTLAEIGATVDLDASLAAARQLGRDDDAASRLAFTSDILRGNQVVPLQTAIDLRVLNTWFDRVDGDIDNPAVNAHVVVKGTEVSVSPDSTGIVVDREAARKLILDALATLQPVATELPTMVDQPDIRAGDLDEAQATVRKAISAPVRVKFENQTWRLEAETLASYLVVDTVIERGQPTAKMHLDTERLAADLRTQFGPEVNRDPVNARVGWNDERGLIALDPSQTGATLKAGDFAEAVAASFLNDHERVEVPVVVTRPEIDDENLDALGIETRLGRGDSYYAGGSWQRDENIGVGTSLLNGTLVRPGGTFSFNDAIGEITADKGYVEASVVVAERVGKDIGGGICQVSTTVFRAALLAGMPITEWHPHTYRLKNYEAEGWGPGFDASILQYGADPAQWADLEFENYTDGWLLVEAWTSYPNVIVNIYGKDTGRTIEIVDQWQSDPISNYEDVEVYTNDLPSGTVQQTEWPQAGLEAAFTRVIYDAEGNEVARRQFYTYFKGRGNVYQVGTG